MLEIAEIETVLSNVDNEQHEACIRHAKMKEYLFKDIYKQNQGRELKTKAAQSGKANIAQPLI